MTIQPESPVNSVDFRALVAECAQDPRIVASFNVKYASDLKPPLNPLLTDLWTNLGCIHCSSIAEATQLQRFIQYVHNTLWNPSGGSIQ
jgi:hypothetical protein